MADKKRDDPQPGKPAALDGPMNQHKRMAQGLPIDSGGSKSKGVPTRP